MSAFDLETFLPYRLAVLTGRVSREFSRRYHERYGISRPEWRVVAHLAHSGPVSVREIHRRVDMDKSRVSRAATRLEEAGYIRKEANPDDGRLVTLTLTEAGHQMMTELSEMARSYQEELLARLGPSAEGLTDGMARLAQKSDQTD
ncbi:MarR family winged helix-turn-helix transcriptional regulator [Tropicimonas marinistellae]|uniref:MarR family winged helix-turn-helix transcriptional regulator n=1 Tax=Tropicimonas marinistellae TaxID=1739787 RepID=UPI000832851F|nr:MarR family transcriptional regulator [Tropicimonas marinistellae]